MEENKCISMFCSHSEGGPESGEATEENKMQLSDLRASEGKESALGLREEQ